MGVATGTAARPAVLLVSPDRSDRDRFGAWVEEAGWTAIICPGPVPPWAGCLGMAGRPCPQVDGVDVVVLDASRLPGLVREGLPARLLLRHYLAKGKPVVVIADRYRKDRTFRPEQVAVIRPNPGRESLLLMTRAMLREATRW